MTTGLHATVFQDPLYEHPTPRILFPRGRTRRWVASGSCPTWLKEVWDSITDIPWLLHSDEVSDTRSRQHINALKLVVVVTTVFTYGPSYMRNRQVLFFVDNTVCLSVCVQGYARSPRMTVLVNALHLALAHLKCHVWWEYVPSQTNGTDFPSSPYSAETSEFYDKEGFQVWSSPLRLPSFDNLGTRT